MPQSLNIARYPASFLELAARMELERKSIEVEFVDSKMAHATRFKLNGFRRAMGMDENLSRAHSVFMSSILKLRNNGTTVTLIIEPADDSAMSRAIESALGNGHSISHVIVDEFQSDALKAPVEHGGAPQHGVQAKSALSSEDLINAQFGNRKETK